MKTSTFVKFSVVFLESFWKESQHKAERNSNIFSSFTTVSVEWTISNIEKELHVHWNKVSLLQMIVIMKSILFTELTLYTNWCETARYMTLLSEKLPEATKAE